MPLDKQDELFYQVDTTDQVVGAVSRAEAHSNPSIIHRSTQIVLFNNSNQTLLQKRSPNKDKWPGYWTVAASGHVTYGDDYAITAVRELEEELGIALELQYHSKLLMKSEQETEFAAIFYGFYDQTPTELDEIEVEAVQWVDGQELLNLRNMAKLTINAELTFQVLGWL